MSVTSIYFLILSLILLLIYYQVNQKYRIFLLVALSSGFIASYSIILLGYILFYTTINYFLGLIIYKEKFKKAVYRIALGFNILQLILINYSSFAIDPVFHFLSLNLEVSRINEIIIPIGISYFTLQGIGYIINIKMNWEKPEMNFLRFFLYIIFYPKFLSGPIERSNHFMPQLNREHSFNRKQVTDGLRIVLFGLFKKIVIANQLAQFVNLAHSNLETANSISLWMVWIIQPLYLYFDFSGYSDIAIGYAKTLGIELLPNFNRPFFSENMTNFWKRFHISLSSWFNDYIFRQTSFKYRRWGVGASVLALFVTWTLFGIWHGAGWNFMVLGFLQALAIIYEFFTKKWRVRLFSRMNGTVRVWTGRIVTYLFYACSLVFFFSPDLQSSFSFFQKMGEKSSGVINLGIPSQHFLLIIILIFLILVLEMLENDFIMVFDKLKAYLMKPNRRNLLIRWGYYYLLVILILFFWKGAQQFIYFQF